MRWLLLSALLVGCGSDSGVGAETQGGAAGELPEATGGALETQAGSAGEPGGSGIGGAAQGGALPVAGTPGRGGAGVGGAPGEGGTQSIGGATGSGGAPVCSPSVSCARFESDSGEDCLIVDVPGLTVGEVRVDPERQGWTLVECISQLWVPKCADCDPPTRYGSPTGYFCELVCEE